MREHVKRKKTTRRPYGFWDNARFHWKEAVTREPLAVAACVPVVLFGAALPLLNALLPRLVLRGLEERWEFSYFAGTLAVLVLLMAALGVIKTTAGTYVEWMAGPFEDVYNQRLLKKRLTADYAVLESRRFNDDAYAVYDSLYLRYEAEMRSSMKIWCEVITALIGAAVYGGILLTRSALILALVVFPTVITFFLQKKAREHDRRLRTLAEGANRKMSYVEQKAVDFGAGKDIRIYDLSGWLLGILRKERKISEGYVKQWEKGYLAANWVDAALCFLRDVSAYLFLIAQIVQGRMAVSDFVWYMAVVASCQQACAKLLEQGERLGRLNQDYERLRRFLDQSNGDAFSGTEPEKKSGAVEIDFHDVSFSYPESEEATLKGLNFTIRPGEKIALVGRNGAGKTTLVKLLCGLYQPASGEIRVDKKRMEDYEKESYYGMISAVFQNVKLLPLTVAQNVAAESGGRIDRERVREALRLAGLWEKIEALPRQENTSLARGIVDGAVDLSGGELQKLWMARAFYKDAPLLILDEPTAALDPLAEQEVYEKYLRMSEGKTSLFISHRLSSTRFCDRIFFMEDGRITEEGSHRELLEKNGAYARLYRIQSQYYKEADGAEGSGECGPDGTEGSGECGPDGTEGGGECGPDGAERSGECGPDGTEGGGQNGAGRRMETEAAE